MIANSTKNWNGHISGPKGCPDMIFSAFDVKLCEKFEGPPPKARHPAKKYIENQPKQQKCLENGGCGRAPVSSARAGSPGGRQPPGTKTSGVRSPKGGSSLGRKDSPRQADHRTVPRIPFSSPWVTPVRDHTKKDGP